MDFIFSNASKPASIYSQTPVQYLSGVQRPGSENDRLSPFSTGVKVPHSYAITTPYVEVISILR